MMEHSSVHTFTDLGTERDVLLLALDLLLGRHDCWKCEIGDGKRGAERMVVDWNSQVVGAAGSAPRNIHRNWSR